MTLTVGQKKFDINAEVVMVRGEGGGLEEVGAGDHHTGLVVGAG